MQLVWDLLRGVALAEAALLVVALVIAVVQGLREYRSGALPTRLAKHVWWNAVGISVVSIGYGAYIATRLGHGGATWYGGPVAVLGYSIALYGAYEMLTFQREAYGKGHGRRLRTESAQLGVVPVAMYAILFTAVVIGFYQGTGIDQRNCQRDNRQDRVLYDLLSRSTTPQQLKRDGRSPLTTDQRKQLNAFLARLRGEKCPTV